MGSKHAKQRSTVCFFVAMNIFVDSHAHIYQPVFDDDLPQIIQRALDNGVTKIVLPNIDIESIERVRKTSLQYPGVCFPTIGLHPCDVKEDYLQVLSTLKEIAFNPVLFPENKIYALGETGLDYYWDITYKEQQKEALRIQISWAQELNLPIILHTRDSVSDTINIVKEMYNEELKGVFHCFSGSFEEAKTIVEMEGFYLGIGGPLTYKNATLPTWLKEIPLEKILLETDAPYLPPVPYRGKRNESSYIPLIAERMGEVYQKSIAEIAEITTKNACTLFEI